MKYCMRINRKVRGPRVTQMGPSSFFLRFPPKTFNYRQHMIDRDITGYRGILNANSRWQKFWIFHSLYPITASSKSFLFESFKFSKLDAFCVIFVYVIEQDTNSFSSTAKGNSQCSVKKFEKRPKMRSTLKIKRWEYKSLKMSD